MEVGRSACRWFVVLAAACLLSAAPSHAAEKAPDISDACLGCHGQKGVVFTFQNGETREAFVDAAMFRESRHRDLPCTACHSEFSEQDHPRRVFKNRDQYASSSSAVCRQCHADDQLRKSPVHAALFSGGNRSPVCTGCHNPHTITSVRSGVAHLSENDLCLRCHQHALAATLRNGDRVSLTVNAKDLAGSVHAKLACFDCHFGFSSSQHPKRNFGTRRDFSIAQAEACRRCHFDKYTKNLESIHYAIMRSGNLSAPVCTDCHGSHLVLQARADKLKSSKRCGTCHQEIFVTYTGSVHGTALVTEHNTDVPICADCHTAHTILEAHSQDYREKVPDICGKCHGDAALMKKYGLYPGVVNSYLQDFHGVTLRSYQLQKAGAEAQPSRKDIATCVDCHGVHDITKTSGPTTNLVKARLMKRCQKCHAGATEGFPDAWLSHYEPSLKNAPLVFLINLTYKLFIPFMLIGLILQILLHIWRYAVNR
jgi:predicted CXXCH cytochrome family protein